MAGEDNNMWDPNTWGPTTVTEYRIYIGDTGKYAVVDEVDYVWAIKWKWTLSGKGYIKRSAATGSRANGTRVSVSLYLHVEIMKRSKRRRPTPAHVLADHKDLDKFNCRRKNLRWATYSMNNKNRADYNKKRNARKYNGAG